MPENLKKKSFLRRSLDYPAHLLLLSFIILVALLIQVTRVFVLPFQYRTWLPGLLQFCIRRVLATLWTLCGYLQLFRISMEGRPLDEPIVFIANHPSFLDALLLIPYLPRTACVYKSALERSFLPRSIAGPGGFISNKESLESIRDGVNRLRGGYRVLCFPEGTRTDAPLMGPWKSSYALMAARAQTPVQPLFIELNPRVFPKGVPWWKPPGFPVQVRIRFGLSIPPPAEHSVRNFHKEVEASFRNELSKSQIVSARSPH